MTSRILPPKPNLKLAKIRVPVTNAELHQAIDTLLKTRTLSRIFGETVLQFLWIAKTADQVAQVDFARRFGKYLDQWALVRKGGRP
jgi:hypothetical protein